MDTRLTNIWWTRGLIFLIDNCKPGFLPIYWLDRNKINLVRRSKALQQLFSHRTDMFLRFIAESITCSYFDWPVMLLKDAVDTKYGETSKDISRIVAQYSINISDWRFIFYGSPDYYSGGDIIYDQKITGCSNFISLIRMKFVNFILDLNEFFRYTDGYIENIEPVVMIWNNPKEYLSLTDTICDRINDHDLEKLD